LAVPERKLEGQPDCPPQPLGRLLYSARRPCCIGLNRRLRRGGKKARSARLCRQICTPAPPLPGSFAAGALYKNFTVFFKRKTDFALYNRGTGLTGL